MGWGRGKGGNDAATSGATGSGYYASEEKTGNTMMDTTAWIINNEFANFVLLNTMAIKYMCMVGYTFMHGCNVFKNCGKDTATSYKCITMMLACTGGGILVPIFLNTIPVTIGIDAYPMAILTSFLLHLYFPILREVVDLSPIFKSLLIVFYETIRTYVVTLFVGLAAATIPASQFSFPIFGPIICGTIGGCGGYFLPLNKGLDPIKNDGLAPAMFSALLGATFYHFYTHYAQLVAATGGHDDGTTVPIPIIGSTVYTLLWELHIDYVKKGKVFVASYFLLYAFYKNGMFSAAVSTPPKISAASDKRDIKNPASVKDEKKSN